MTILSGQLSKCKVFFAKYPNERTFRDGLAWPERFGPVAQLAPLSNAGKACSDGGNVMVQSSDRDIEWMPLDSATRTVDGPEPRSTSRFVSALVAAAVILGAVGIGALLLLAPGDQRSDGEGDVARIDRADGPGDEDVVIRASAASADAISPREQALLGQTAGTALLVTRHDGRSPFLALVSGRRVAVLRSRRSPHPDRAGHL